MNIYIAGPMTGYPNFNLEAFTKAEEHLRHNAWNPVNPATAHRHDLEGMTGNEPVTEQELREIIRTDLDLLQGCQAMWMLEGWEKSLGARAEHAVGVWLGLEIRYEL